MTGAASPVAPRGLLRAAINFRNLVIARRGKTLDESSGVSVAIARELAHRLHVPLQIVAFEGAEGPHGVIAAAKRDVYDVAFLATNPDRFTDLHFTAPYALIEGGYLVRRDSPLTAVEHVDRPRIRIAVGARNAYDIYLARTIKHAEILERGTSEEAITTFLRDGIEVLAGIKGSLLDVAEANPALRVLPGHFIAIGHALMTVHGSDALAIIAPVIEELKASGFVARELAASGQSQAQVAPPGP